MFDDEGRVPDRAGLVPPKLISAQRAMRVYPPIRWAPLRVMNPWHKLAVLIGQWLALGGVAYLLGMVLPDTVVGPVSQALLVVVIVTIARSFRGPDEPVDPPRVWWRLTARPRAGWWLTILYAMPAVGMIAESVRHPGAVTIVGGVTAAFDLLLAVAFLNSSLRLTALQRRPRQAASADEECPHGNAPATKLGL